MYQSQLDRIKQCPTGVDADLHAALIYYFGDYPRDRSMKVVLSHLDFMKPLRHMKGWDASTRKQEVLAMADFLNIYYNTEIAQREARFKAEQASKAKAKAAVTKLKEAA